MFFRDIPAILKYQADPFGHNPQPSRLPASLDPVATEKSGNPGQEGIGAGGCGPLDPYAFNSQAVLCAGHTSTVTDFSVTLITSRFIVT